jgi:hypothetical protein
MLLHDKKLEKINPATEDTLKSIEEKIGSVGGGSGPEITDGSQKTQVVTSAGANVDFATSAKQTDGSQKTKVVDADGNVLSFVNGLAVTMNAYPDALAVPFITGKATGGSIATIEDNTKNFVPLDLVGKKVKFTTGGIEYIRSIIFNGENEIGFSPNLGGEHDTAIVGEQNAGQVTVTTAAKGDSGYTLELVAGVGESVPLSAALAGGVLTVTLATDGAGDLITSMGNYASDIAFAINALPEFTASMTGSGGVMSPTTEPIEFTGGIDPVELVADDPYQVWQDVATETKQGDGTQKAQTVDQAGINSESIIRTFRLTITRPANGTAYAAGDVIGDVSAEMPMLADVAKANGYGVALLGIRAQTNDTGLAGKALNVSFYNFALTTVPADNEAFVMDDGNADEREGYVTLTFGSGILAKEAQNIDERIVLNPVARSIGVVVVTTGGFTPSANSTWIKLYVKCLLTN